MMDGLMNIYKENIIGMNLFSTPDQLIGQMMNNPVLGIIILNNNFEFFECSEAASYFLGISEKDKMCTLDKCQGDVAETVMNMVIATRMSKTPHEVTIRSSKDDNPLLLHICVTLLTDATYKDSGFCIFITNIDDDVGREAKYTSDNGISEPLMRYLATQIQNVSEDLNVQCDQEDVVRENILQDTRIMNDLVSFIGSYYEISMNKAEWCNLHNSVEEAISRLTGRISIDPPSISYKLNNMCVLGGKTTVTTFENLIRYSSITNANNISITGCVRNGTLIINYVDNGIGITKDKKIDLMNDDPRELGPELYIVGRYLRLHNFTYIESGIPGEGLDLQMMIPPSKYSISFE